MTELSSTLPVSRSRLAAALALVIAATALTILLVHRHHHSSTASSLAATHAAADPAIAGTVVQMGPNTCGLGWNGGPAGHQRLAFWNTFGNGSEAYLVANATGTIVLDAEGIGLNATRSYAVNLAPGTYHLACVNAETGVPVAGPDEKVTGSYHGPVTAGVHVLSSNDFIPAIGAYGAWVGGQLPVLHRMIGRLESDLVAGDVARAEQDWLAAHRKYETLGAAYGAFGDADARINPMPAAGVSPATDPDLVGFHKIEALLWSGARPAAAVPAARSLAAAVADLSTTFANGRDIKPVEMGLRSHEILENAVQFELTDRDDAGSHTELATIDANLAGTRKALDAIRSLVTPQLDLAPIDAAVQRATTLVDSYRHRGAWTPFTTLTQTQHEQLNAVLSQAVEDLSRVAVVTDPRQGIQ